MSAKPDRADPVVVVDYDPQWPRLFDAESEHVRRALGDGLVSVEHIGSTAVPSLAAKPVIDMLVGLRTLALSSAALHAMERLEYEYLGEYGIPGPLFFHKGRPRSHYIHAVLFGSDQWERHLAFRDYRRAHADEARRYADFKRDLAAEVAGDRERYVEGKRTVASELEKRARAWRAARVA